MATERQVAANRRNAAKSTGPRSEAGKAVSRGNAVRHGLTASTVVLAWEDASAFEAARRQFHSELAPAGPTEAALVEHLAAVIWRLRRASAYEAALVQWVAHRQAEAFDGEGVTLGQVFLVSDAHGLDDGGPVASRNASSRQKLETGRLLEVVLGKPDFLNKLGRYEVHLLRQVERTLAELKRLREPRGGLLLP